MNNIAPAFTASVKYHIGNGDTTKFWHDNWLGTPLKNSFPALYQLVQDKQASVAQNAHAGQWFLQHPLLTTAAQSEKEQLLSQLQHTQLGQSHDVVTWLRSTDGFSVSSAYRFLFHTPAPTSCIRNIWLIKAPLRVQIFAWLMLNNRLSTIDNSVNKGWHLPNICALCRRDAETVHHLFQQCTLVQQIRGYIHAAFAQQFSIRPKFKGTDSTQILTDTTEGLNARQWELTTCFVIWRERCRRVFSDKELTIVPLVSEIPAEYTNWFQCNLSSSVLALQQ